MLGRNGNIAYVRYDSHGRIVPGGPIISPYRPKVGFWQPVSLVTGNNVTSNALRAFVRLDAYGRVVPSSLLLLSKEPSNADSGTYWLEINAIYRPPVVPTTTTTTTHGGGGLPTAWIGRVTSDPASACYPGNYVFYTASPTINGNIVYQDAALTIPLASVGVVYISTVGYYYQLNQNSVATLLGPCSNFTTTTTTTADPLYYYLTNKYNCPDCSTIVESNFLIKGSTPVNIGDWVIRNPGTGSIAFQVLSVASPNPSAYLVDTYGGSPTCPCPSTTTTTTTTSSFAWTVSSSSVSNRTSACNYGFDYGRQTLWASTTDPNTVSKFYTDQSLTQVYQGNINDYYVYMMGWPSGQLYVAQMNPGGDLTSQQTCSSSTTTTTTTTVIYYYYYANRYVCTNCNFNSPVETNVLIKVASLNFGDGSIWLDELNSSNRWYITSASTYNPSATLVQIAAYGTNCGGCQ